MVVFTLTGCGGEPVPVGRVLVEPGIVELGYPHSVPIQIRFEPSAELAKQQGRAKVFVHLLDQPGSVLRTFDHTLPEQWVPGQELSYTIDLYQSALGESLPAGNYMLTVGLYDSDSGRRWTLQTAGEEVARQEYRVASVSVPAGDSPGPEFVFSGDWLPLEPGQDRQILGRRWLTGAATLSLSSLRGPGSLRLELQIPEWAEAEYEQATVELTTSCSEQTVVVAGAAVHRIELQDLGSEGEELCEVYLMPAYQVPPEVGRTELACLVKAAWQPGE